MGQPKEAELAEFARESGSSDGEFVHGVGPGTVPNQIQCANHSDTDSGIINAYKLALDIADGRDLLGQANALPIEERLMKQESEGIPAARNGPNVY